jgi:hypothetical protein
MRRTYKQKLVAAAGHERIIVFCSVGFAFLLVGAGGYLAHRSTDHHWVNRAGAAVLASDGVFVVLEFFRRERLRGVRRATFGGHSATQSPPELQFLENQIGRAELRLVIIAALLAIVGEVLHGFGDLLFRVLFG